MQFWILLAFALVPVAYTFSWLPTWGDLLITGVIALAAKGLSLVMSQSGPPGSSLFDYFVWSIFVASVVMLTLWVANAFSFSVALLWWFSIVVLITLVVWVLWNLIGRPS